MKNIYTIALVLTLALVANTVDAQNLVFSYQKASTGEGLTSVVISVTNSGAATENLGAFTTQVYLNDNETTVVGADFSPVIDGFGWGTSNQTLVNYTDATDPDILIEHTGYFSYQNFDFVNSTGVDIPAGSTVLLGTVFFDNADGVDPSNGGDVWLAEGDEIAGLTYSDINFDPEHLVVADQTTQQQNLPIKLHSFTATKGDNSVILDWTTASEINASHFDVQRSQDLNTWKHIGTVQADGESSELLDYTLTDRDLPLNLRDAEKTFYYRLMMVDSDGTSEYSDVRVARFDQVESTFIAYPNPAYNEVFVNLSSISVETGAAQMSVIDKSGRLVKQVTLSTNDDISVDVSDIAPGAYFFVVRQGEKTFSQKIIKID